MSEVRLVARLREAAEAWKFGSTGMYDVDRALDGCADEILAMADEAEPVGGLLQTVLKAISEMDEEQRQAFFGGLTSEYNPCCGSKRLQWCACNMRD